MAWCVFQVELKQVFGCRCNLIQVEKPVTPFLSYVLFQFSIFTVYTMKNKINTSPCLCHITYTVWRWSTLTSYLINPFELLNALLLLFSWYPVVWKLVVYNLNLRCLVFLCFYFLFQQFWCHKILFRTLTTNIGGEKCWKL